MPVAVVNETMAAKYWPGKDPIGQRLKVKDRWLQIVGVARNVNYREQARAAPDILLCADATELLGE